MNGDVLICCRDWQNQNIIGNVYNSTLYDIWNCEQMKKIQDLISRKEYDKVECCKDCLIKLGTYER